MRVVTRGRWDGKDFTVARQRLMGPIMLWLQSLPIRNGTAHFNDKGSPTY